MIRKRLFSIAYMFGLTLFFTTVVTGIYQVNQQRIAINEEIKLQKIVLQVLGIELEPEATGFQVKEIFESRVKFEEREGRVLYRGFTADENLATLGEQLALPPFLEPHRASIEAGLKPIETAEPA